jgi:hypothetical protein
MSRLGLARIAARALWVAGVVLFVAGGWGQTVAWIWFAACGGELAIFCAEDPARLQRRVGRADVAQAALGVSAVLALGVVASVLWP